MTLQELRDMLCKQAKDGPNPYYKQGYIEGVLDLYNYTMKEHRRLTQGEPDGQLPELSK